MSEQSKKNNGRKLILPPQRKTPTYKRSDVVVLPDLQSVLEDASTIISTEMAKYKNRVQIGSAPLDPESARIFQGYVKAAIDISKDAREQDKQYEDSNLSDAELLTAFLDNLPKEEVVRLLQDTLNSKTEPENSENSDDKDVKNDS